MVESAVHPRRPRRPSLGRIRVLDDPLVNRIAAGEVVERPASALKELMENALDAGARRIDVRVEAGGRALIRVADDGCGMDRDDVLLALERHATSKLSAADDLSRIATLGFRGEALPSLAAVSRMVLRSAPEGGEGTEVEVRGGRILAVRPWAGPRGTTVEVAGLFFNVPARRKFLRSEPTELGHLLRLAERAALSRPDVRFRVEQAGRVLLDAPPASTPRERIARLWGEALASRLLPVAGGADGLEVAGFVAPPPDARTARDAQLLFVNGRPVADRLLLHAVHEGYANTVARDRHPAFFLFLTLPPERVDVNVHPQKTEVRFAHGRLVHDAVRDAVMRALGRPEAVPTWSGLRPEAATRAAGGAPAAMLSFLERAEGPPRSWAVGEPAPEPLRVVPLAQFLDSYLLAQDGEDLLIVDQHAAHERVLFERFLAQAERGPVEVQRLLFPRVLDLTPAQLAALEEEAAELRRLGFHVEPFGPGAVRLDAVPALLQEEDPAEMLRAVWGRAGEARTPRADLAPLRHRLVTTAACKAAIKIRHPLTREGMAALLEALFRADSPTTCPHGRPVIFRLSREEIERTFRRR